MKLANRINIAVISDLHVGAGARCEDLNPESTESSPDVDYIGTFRSYVESHSLIADYLVIPGDVTNKANYNEFRLASEKIIEIAKCLGVQENKIVFVPGNHDSSWSDIEAAKSQNLPSGLVLERSLSNMLSDDSLVFRQSMNNSEGSFTRAPFCSLWNFEDIVFLSVNSSPYIDPGDTVKHGKISNEQLFDLDKLLTDKSSDFENKCKCAVTHHHPINYIDTTFNQPDLSTMQGGEALLETLSKHGFDLLIHGHKHIPRFKFRMDEHSNPMLIACAGSFSAELEEKWFGPIGNAFHILSLMDLCEEKAVVRGVYKSWAYVLSMGWTESDFRYSGIEHENYFGSISSLTELTAIVRPLVEDELKQNPIVPWTKILELKNELKYIPNRTLARVLNAISNELSSDIIGLKDGKWIDSINQIFLARR